MEHIDSCAQLEAEPCTRLISLHGEAIGEHWFSGWPGAYCLKCGEEDKNEVCIGIGCECQCHEEFWRSYDTSNLPKEDK